MDQANPDGKQAVVPGGPRPPRILTVVRRYVLVVIAVSLALGVALLFQRWHFRDIEVPLLLFAVAIAAWFGGLGAAVLAWVLSCISFDYFFVEPIYSLAVAPAEIPYFVVFALFAALLTWFSAVRRRVE